VEPEEFEAYCLAKGKPYELINPGRDQYAHFRFSGKFLQQSVIWDAHLYTLAYYFNEVVETSQPHQARQFIEVGEPSSSGRIIRIALSLPVIDEPAIIKTMIMIRQYKRLASGHYEYGETINLA
jgi:hypothetical protein